MSHRDTCPDRWEAQREGERAFDRGYGSFRNPYGGYGEDRCEEAEREWRRGWYNAEERHAEEAAEQRAAERQAEARRQDAMAAEAEQAEYYAYLQEQYSEEDMRALDDSIDEASGSTDSKS